MDFCLIKTKKNIDASVYSWLNYFNGVFSLIKGIRAVAYFVLSLYVWRMDEK